MACNRPELDDLKELLTCPVCFNTFNNPRNLGCGHQFCEECLRSIADRHVDGDVICPTCRALTVVHGDVTSLPRAVLTSQIQETVEYLPHKPKPADLVNTRVTNEKLQDTIDRQQLQALIVEETNKSLNRSKFSPLIPN